MGPDPYSEDGEPLLGRRSECQPTRPVRSGTRRCTKHGPILSDVNHNMSPQKGADRLTAGRPVNTGETILHMCLEGKDPAWLCLAQIKWRGQRSIGLAPWGVKAFSPFTRLSQGIHQQIVSQKKQAFCPNIPKASCQKGL